MNLYILRHAIAKDAGEWKGSDADRPLTKEGLKKMKKAAKGFHRLGVMAEWIITSPYRRAYDTAMLVAKELKLKKNLKISRMLTPDGDMKALVRHIALNFRSWESIILVGHEPHLGKLIGLLTTGMPEKGPLMEKGGLAKLQTDSLSYGQCAQLEWLLTSKILKKLT